MRDPVRPSQLRPSGPRTGIPGQIAVTALVGAVALQAVRLAGLPGDAAGWLAASVAWLLGCVLVAVLMRRSYPHDRLGGGNIVTLLRGALVCALLPPLLAGEVGGWAVAITGGVAFALDGVDGWLARRSGLASDFGGRFEMEVDAALALILSLHALAGPLVGAEVLMLGLIRYGFVVAGWFRAWLRAPLPQRLRRKLVCVMQLAVLIALQLPVMPADPAIWLTRLMAMVLIWSFVIDIRWLWQHRRERRAGQIG